MDESQKTIKQLRKTISGLRSEANEFFNKILCRKTRGMFLYPKAQMRTQSWTLDDVYQRTLAAQELGWTVVLRADEDGLHIDYAEKLPTSRPWNF